VGDAHRRAAVRIHREPAHRPARAQRGCARGEALNGSKWLQGTGLKMAPRDGTDPAGSNGSESASPPPFPPPAPARSAAARQYTSSSLPFSAARCSSGSNGAPSPCIGSSASFLSGSNVTPTSPSSAALAAARARAASAAASSAASSCAPHPRHAPPRRRNWTSLVPPLMLTGQASPLPSYLLDKPRPSPRTYWTSLVPPPHPRHAPPRRRPQRPPGARRGRGAGRGGDRGAARRAASSSD
jgi:hypothetical protein